MIEGRQAVTEDYTVVDLEMTGLTPKQDKIIEIGAVKVRGRKVIDTYGTLVKSARPIPDRVSKLTGITNEMMENGMGEDQAIQTLLSFIGDDVIVGHNISFDYSFLKQWAVNRKAPLQMSAFYHMPLISLLFFSAQFSKNAFILLQNKTESNHLPSASFSLKNFYYSAQ